MPEPWPTLKDAMAHVDEILTRPGFQRVLPEDNVWLAVALHHLHQKQEAQSLQIERLIGET